jgi:hypothetical protein
MNGVATWPEQKRNELFTLSAQKRGMGSIAIIEKDFWVCWTLKQLFEHPELSALLIFKGGTSLSKVYGLIDRFSEDIDLVLDWRKVDAGKDPMAERSKRQQNQLNEALNENAISYIAETMMPWLQEALGSHCELEIKASSLGKPDMLASVVEFKKKFYPRGWANYDAAVTGSLKLIPPDHIATEMEKITKRCRR